MEVSNHRPISLLSTPSKLLESQVRHIIDEHLAVCSVTTRKQWGFCKGLSTEFMLLAMTEKWKQALDNNSCVGAVSHTQFYHANVKVLAFLFMNGFCVISQIDHNILLFTPSSSSPGCIHYGVPQESLLGPRLYSIFVNDLPDCVGDVYLYADDITIPFLGDSIDEAFATLNACYHIDNILQWSKNNQLTIHPIKTEAMLFRKSPFIGPLVPPLYFRSDTIRVVESITCLGVKLDCM